MDRPRRHVPWLVLVALVGLIRGLFWVMTIEVPGPVDEAQHVHYVQSLARGDGPPEVGQSRLSADVLGLVKDSATSPWRSVPIAPDPSDPRWGASAQSYEGAQPPLYYALVTPVYGALRPLGLKPAVYALRVATVLLSLLAVPVAYLLGRELVPRRPVVWLAAPALLVMVEGFNANLATVTNDALIVPLAAGTLVAVARAARRGLSVRLGVIVGVLLGLALLTKATAISLVPLVVIGVLFAARKVSPAVRFLVSAGVAAALVYAPWLVWNLTTYGAPSGSAELNFILGPLQPGLGRSVGAAGHHLVDATRGFWDFEVAAPRLGWTMWWWTALVVIGMVLGLAIAARRRQARDAVVLAWLASAWPIAFTGMLAIVFVVFSGRSGTVGRHLYPALVPLVVAISAGVVSALGTRRGIALLGIAILGGVWCERADVHRYLRVKYTDGVIGNLAPKVDQPDAAGVAVFDAVVAGAPSCPTRAVALAFVGDVPRVMTMRTARGSVEAVGVGRIGGLDAFTLPAAVRGPVAMSFQRPFTLAVSAARSPAMRMYCRVDDPSSVRFAQLFGPDHVDMPYAMVRAWPWLWVVAVGIGLGWTLSRWPSNTFSEHMFDRRAPRA